MKRWFFIVFFAALCGLYTETEGASAGNGLRAEVSKMLGRNRYRLNDILHRVGIRIGIGKELYEALPKGWFTSSHTGKFAEHRAGQVYVATVSGFGRIAAWSDSGSGIKYGDLNQDAFAIRVSSESTSLIVIDGISTGGSGEIATEVAVDSLRNTLPHSSLHNALVGIQDSLLQRVVTDESVSRNYGVATVGVEIRDRIAIVSHSGDTRLLHLRDDMVLFQTADHNPTYQLVLQGIMPPEEYIQDHIDKSQVDKALRIPDLATTGDPEDMVEKTWRNLDSGDILVLASDAVWNLFTNTEIASFVKGRSVEDAVAHIRVQVARRVGENKARDDNFTIVIYHHDPEGLLL